MKKLGYIVAILGLTLVTACGGNSKLDKEKDSLRADSIMRDSIRKAEIQQKLDSIRQDSMWRYRETPDLALFELHGPVKSVT